jgi:predicted metal-dependent HD superfamily phosphohydrolase
MNEFELAAFNDHWQAYWVDLNAKGSGQALMQSVWEAYGEKQRHYHTVQHLEECLSLFEQYQYLAKSPAEIAMAIWFHDAVYDVYAHDNEEQSARWAKTSLIEHGVDISSVHRVVDLILATKHDHEPSDADAILLVDIDLAILGADPARFDEYEQQVRDEYAYVLDAVFYPKRAEILTAFLSRESIYKTPALNSRFEAQARTNLEKALIRTDRIAF